MYNESFISITCIVYKHINLCVIFYDKLTVLATLHILTSDTIEIPSGVSPQLLTVTKETKCNIEYHL